MHKIIFLLSVLTMVILVGCGESADNTVISKPSVPNPSPKSLVFDVPIPYFSQPGHQIRITKQFDFIFTNDRFRGRAFHYGKRLLPNELTGDGRGCVILQPLSTTDMGSILVQGLTNIVPVEREALGTEVPDDFRFVGVKFDFSIVGGGILYCFRHESLGPVTLEDFRLHFAGYLEFSE